MKSNILNAMRLPLLLLAILGILLCVSSANASQTSAGEYASASDALAWQHDSHRKDRIVVETDPREAPVKRHDLIPARWLQHESPEFAGKAQPGEFYVFQVSLFNNGEDSITVQSVSIDGNSDAVCLNEAVKPQSQSGLVVKPAQIQTLWIGVQSSKPASLKGTVVAKVSLDESGAFQTVRVPYLVEVEGSPVKDEGVDEGWRLARLKWLLPSGLGISREPTKGFQPIRRKGNEIELTATKLMLAASGLPKQIESLSSNLKLFAMPVAFTVLDHGRAIEWANGPTTFDPPRDDRASWRTVLRSPEASLVCEGSVEFDGFLRYRLTLQVLKPLEISDAGLKVFYRTKASKYQLGLGFHGGYTPDSTDWKWDVSHQQDCVWLGDVSAGAQWRFKGANYRRPLVNIYYGYQPLNLPESWGNEGRGGIRVGLQDQVRVLDAYCGKRLLLPGQRLQFNFDVQITPSRPIDTEKQWATRFYQPNERSIEGAIDKSKQDGANVINVHQGNPINPFINYPFNDFSVPDLMKFVTSAHQQNIRVKLYYTTRELTLLLPEIWALKSFGGAVIEPGPGPRARTVVNPNGPDPALTDALGDDFIPAWSTALNGKYAGKKDLAVITRPDSAWTDYYLNGLEWLVKNIQIDGVYIDDTALDRSSLQRARRILEAGRPAPLIDLHSWNHENPLAASGSSTSIYMDLFPYLDRIWFGEGFDYRHASPDYWLVAMSGIPYGVMSEMLQDGGNVWRGMLFGETCRLGWSGDPRSMWKFWDSFGMKGSQMIGWWDDSCPVKTDSKDVLATVYRKQGKALIAIANWTDKAETVSLKIDWKALGLDPAHARLVSPAIEGFQESASWKVGERIEVPAAKGWLVVVE